MTRAAWKKKKRGYQRYFIASVQGESWWAWSEVERIGPVYLVNALDTKKKMQVYVEIFFKSGTSEKQYFPIERKFKDVRVTSIFGGRNVRTPWDVQQYFDSDEATGKVDKTRKEWLETFFKHNRG